MYLCIGTGAGSAFTEQGRLVVNSKFLPENGWIYNTKFKESIIDDYLSTRGLAALSQKKYFGEIYNGYDLHKMAEHGNTSALALFQEFGQDVHDAILKFLESFTVDHLVIGGQISKGFYYFSEPLASYCKTKDISIECIYDTSAVICTGVYSSFLT